MPIVSVLMTAYNREKYIGEAIESVLASTFTDFELIIVDDCSSDTTLSIAKKFEQSDTRVKVFTNTANLGDYKNRNKAASYAAGKYLKYLDSDDLIFPWGLSAMVNCMEKVPSAVLGLSAHTHNHNLRYPVVLQPEDAYKVYFFGGLLLGVGPSSSIIRRDVFEKAGGFGGRQFVGDTELWLKIARVNQVLCLPVNLVYWREHEGQQIREEAKDLTVEALRLSLLKENFFHSECPLSKVDTAKAVRNIKNIKSREILMNILRGNIKSSLNRARLLNLGLKDFISCLKKNDRPEHPFAL